MGVTHIIRGDDHLTNAARQTQIYKALGWAVPAMAHIPLIHGPDGAKLSKRHGALGVDAYRAHGLSAGRHAQLSGAARLEPGDQEIFSTEEMIEAFELSQVGRSPARFDFAKLENINGHYMRATRRSRARGNARSDPALSAGRPGDRRKTRRTNARASCSPQCRA